MDRIYIHDACVLLDLIEGDLLDLWFQLGFETRTTHLVYQEILEEEQFSLLQTYVDADKLILESIAGIEVKGILWVLDMIVERKLLIPQRALNALEAILEAGGRIPSEECGERRQRWGK